MGTGLKRKTSPGGTDRLSTAASLDLPVGSHIDADGVRGYYIDFTSKAIDAAWPPPWLANREMQLHVGTWQWGLGCYERHLAGDGERWLRGAVSAADHAVGLQERDGAWTHLHAMPHTYDLQPPWISAMAQGEGASLLTRVHLATGDARYAEAAELALAPMESSIGRGGVRTTLHGSPFLEEYPTQPPSYVLNGAIFAMWGYRDVGIGLGKGWATDGFQELVDGLAAQIHRFDNGYWSLYDLYPHPIANIASGAYHALHINQLRALERVAPRGQFAAATERFEHFAQSTPTLGRVYAKKAAFRLVMPRNALLANRLPVLRRPAGGNIAPHACLVLCYHAVSESWPSPLAVTPEQLHAQVAHLLQQGYEPVTFHEALYVEQRRRSFAVTFDDGYRSTLERGLPVLSGLGVPATVFVLTDFVGQQGPMHWPGIDQWLDGPHEKELISLSWDEVRVLTAHGWEIGSHTTSHPRLTELNDADLESELVESKRACEHELGTPCLSAAYPFGAHDLRTVAAVRNAGYSGAVTLPDRLHQPSPLRWPRIAVYRGDSLGRFKLKTSRPMRSLRATALWSGARAMRGSSNAP